MADFRIYGRSHGLPSSTRGRSGTKSKRPPPNDGGVEAGRDHPGPAETRSESVGALRSAVHGDGPELGRRCWTPCFEPLGWRTQEGGAVGGDALRNEPAPPGNDG